MSGFLKWLVSSSTMILVYCFGGFDMALNSLLIFIVLDYITGLMKAYKNKKMNSKVGIIGILKKLGMLCMVAVGCVVDHLIGDTGSIRTVLIYCLIANEGISILENLGEMDIFIPKFLRAKLEQLNHKDGDE